jgi:hypothetical protein
MVDSSLSSTLTNEERTVLGERVFCDDELGLTWSPVAELPAEPVLLRQNQRNENILRALSMLEEHDEMHVEDAERAELHRLEGKLNLAIELLAELLRDRSAALTPTSMRFNARGLCWNANDAPQVGALLLTQWYPLPAWPVSLQLHARVASVVAGDGHHRICARLEGLSAVVGDWLEKLVFRRHRRAIAQQRTHRPQSG